MSTITDQNMLFSLQNFRSINSVVKLKPGFNTYFKMEGYNTSTQSLENWHCMGTPLLVPPSGNALINISVVYSWIDR